MILQKEPAVVIGVIATIVLNAIAELSGNGLISAGTAEASTNIVNSGVSLLISILPIILALVTRQFVTSPATAAALKAEVPPGYVKVK